MFTGIVEEIGTVSRWQRTADGYELSIRAQIVLEGTRLGDSIAVNGTCLTVTRFTTDTFTVGISPETRNRTNLIRLRPGDSVNLERSLTPTSRMGGHFVQGHVDDVGVISAVERDEDAIWLAVEASPSIMRYVVPKGFITLDGVSLTVVDVYPNRFTVMLVAYTQKHITLSQQQTGYQVNVEVDVLGKYVEKQLEARFGNAPKQDISLDLLAQYGYQ